MPRCPVAVLAILLLAAGSVACRQSDHDKTVHVIIANHLDVGFTEVDDVVVDTYFHSHFPRAVHIARQMQRAQRDRFVWTTHSFLVSLYLDCPAGMGWRCPSQADVEAFKQAVAAGHITWHGMPHNPHYELFTPDLLRFAVNLTHGLDRQFGLTPKSVVSLRDVPGLTRAAIPLLTEMGVRAISGGVNGFSAPPGVPKNTPFIWRDELSGTQLFAMWHPGGYGGYTPRGQCVEAPGFNHVLCCAWHNWDNGGPPDNASMVEQYFETIRYDYPGARVVASTFEAYVDELAAAAPQLDLPVVTGEIGDTWVHGTGSDVVKLADYLALARARSACLPDPNCDSESPAFYNFSRLLLKVPEHTWGISINTYLDDFTNYTNAYLADQLGRLDVLPTYRKVLRSWRHQYRWIEAALQALPADHPILASFAKDQRRHAAADATHEGALLAGGARQLLRGQPASFQTAHWVIEVDWESGGISRLQRAYPPPSASSSGSDRQPAGRDSSRAHLWRQGSRQRHEHIDGSNSEGSGSRPSRHGSDGGRATRQAELGADWAAGAAQLAHLEYHVYNLSAYDVVWDNYAYVSSRWDDFGKANLTSSSSLQGTATARLVELYHQEDPEQGTTLHLKHAFPDWMVRDAGAPAQMWTVLRAPNDDDALHMSVVWQRKTPTRLPESLFLRLQPSQQADSSSWEVNKLGSWISPSEVMLNGSHSIVAVQADPGVRVASKSGGERLLVSTFDAPLVAMGAPSVFSNNRIGPDMQLGVSVNLVNNVWGTNWPMWIPYWARDINRTFHFKLRAKRTGGQQAVAAS